VGGEARTSLAVVATRTDDTESVIYRNGAADFQLTRADVDTVPFERFGALIVTGTSGNDEEFAVLAHGDDGEEAARALARQAHAVVYKMGARGSRTFSAGRRIDTGVFAVTPLKPTGAGDAFMAGLVTGLGKGLDLEACISRGAAAAAIVVTRVGCAPAMPNERELEAFLAHHADRPD
jgi:5-dehydro-2-deoxygluconokinase